MTPRPARRRQTIFVGSKIRALRKERNLTQADLAQRIGVQQSDLCRMENGEYKVALDTLVRILAVFGVEIGDFFREPGETASPATSAELEVVRLFRLMDETSRIEVLDFVRYKAARRVEAGPT
jgi:transcriptional regulator with XRE-family HTH domain